MSHNMAMKRKLDPPPWSFEQHVPQSPDHTTSNGPAGPPRFGYEPRATSPYLADMAPSVHSVPPGLYATEFAKTREFKKKRRFCSRTRWLLFFLILFILLSSVLFGIILWSWKPCSEDKETPTAAKTIEPDRKGCFFIPPKAIPFQTLPARIKDELDSLEKFIEGEVKQGKASALSGNIVYRDKVIWSGGFGVMDKNAQTPRKPSVSTLYPCASVSKAFTLVMMLKLYSDGSISSLDKPLTNYEPAFSIKNPFNADRITLRLLASARSGLQREAPCYPEKGNNLCPYDYNTMLTRVNNLTLLRKPGEEPQYSNLGIALLGQVLARRFNGDGGFEDYMKRILLDPLGLKNTIFTLTDSLKKEIPLAYKNNKDVQQILDWGWLNPSGGVFSTVEDLAKLEIALFKEEDSDRFLSKAATEKLFAPDYVFPGGTMVGTPWEMRLLGNYVLREKGGSVYGYISKISMIPEMKIAWNFICTDCILDSLLKQRLDTFALLFANVSQTEVRGKALLPADTKPYVGTFKTDTIPSITKMEVKEANEKLYVLVNGQKYFVLHFEKPFEFRLATDENIDCMTYFIIGMRNELLIFDKPAPGKVLSPGFTMFGVYPSGRSHFDRIEQLEN